MILRDILALPPDVALAEGFARTIAELAAKGGAPREAIAAVRNASRVLSLATSEGHTCLSLAELADDLDALRALLLTSGMVAGTDATTPCPLRLDAHDRLYLERHFAAERRVARALAAFGEVLLDDATARAMRARLAERFKGEPPDRQQQAAALVLENRLTVVSGGPGTGKTTTVVQMLALLRELDPACRIVLAAPTGKAAARLRDAVLGGAAALDPELAASLPNEGFTVHRLLQQAAGGGGTLPFEVVVVDEASMLDLMLADQLLATLSPTARLILLGDRQQLAAVEAGAVFAEISEAPTYSMAGRARLARLVDSPPTADEAADPLADRVVWLTKSYRFDSASPLGALAAAVRDGEVAAALAALDAGAPQLALLDDPEPALSPAATAALLDGYADYFVVIAAALGHGAPDPAPLFAAFDRYRILCARREGSRGARGLNETAERICRQQANLGDAMWYPGRPVMVTRNDPLLRLFNGDIGIALPTPSGLRIFFADGAGFRALPPSRLPPHETAFAITVHKSQGSEFDRVALVLPHQTMPLCTRELLYTGLTRARRGALLCAPRGVVANAIAGPEERHSGLRDRLREIMPTMPIALP